MFFDGVDIFPSSKISKPLISHCLCDTNQHYLSIYELGHGFWKSTCTIENLSFHVLQNNIMNKYSLQAFCSNN